MGSRATREIRRAAGLAAVAALVPALSACSVKDDDPDKVAGKQLFVEKCGSCHVLGRAGTKGTTGPNLDEAFQQAQREGFGESAIRGVVHKQILYPARGGVMPANLVDDERAKDVAAYVAEVVSKPGEDSGLLATAVKKAGGGKAIAAAGGVLSIPADPTGQLAYASSAATAPAGKIAVQSPNKSSVPHDITIDGLGKGAVVKDGGVSKFTATLAPGKSYVFYCSVPGHKEAGMQGKLTVK
jgi:mono/diheme cytochrome c family protein